MPSLSQQIDYLYKTRTNPSLDSNLNLSLLTLLTLSHLSLKWTFDRLNIRVEFSDRIQIGQVQRLSVDQLMLSLKMLLLPVYICLV